MPDIRHGEHDMHSGNRAKNTGRSARKRDCSMCKEPSEGCRSLKLRDGGTAWLCSSCEIKLDEHNRRKRSARRQSEQDQGEIQSIIRQRDIDDRKF